jgi:hypothetical protein
MSLSGKTSFKGKILEQKIYEQMNEIWNESYQ